jgi:hypothetical protein
MPHSTHRYSTWCNSPYSQHTPSWILILNSVKESTLLVRSYWFLGEAEYKLYSLSNKSFIRSTSLISWTTSLTASSNRWLQQCQTKTPGNISTKGAATPLLRPDKSDAPSAANVNPRSWKQLNIESNIADSEVLFSSTKSQKMALG